MRLENESLCCTVLPERGGKLSSILEKQTGSELLAQPRGGIYPPLEAGMPFDRGDASGFDDVFPSMGAEHVGDAWYPDHGEIWTTPMCAEQEGAALHLSCDCAQVPCHYEKRLRLEGSSLHCEWRLCNTGGTAFPYVWVCHCLMRWEEGVRFSLPSGPFGMETGLEGVPLPDDPTRTPPNRGMWKYELRGPLGENRCEAFYPHSGLRLRMDFSGLPHLGFWLTAGGYRGEYNFAFEPSDGYFDTVARARANGCLPILEAGQTRSFSIILNVDLTKKERV